MTGGTAAIAGFADIAPRRDTGDTTVMGMLSHLAHMTASDAGLTMRDVDGLVVHDTGSAMGAVVLVEMLGLRAGFVDRVSHGGATGAAMVGRAAMAIATGLCHTCLCLTASIQHRPFRGYAIVDSSPTAEFEEPYGGSGPNYGYAMIARRYMHEYGLTDEQRALVAVQQRDNACVNPDAIFFGQPITVGDVLASPMIVEPLHLLEIVMPTGGAAGVLVTTAERAAHLPHAPVPVLGIGEHVSHWSATYAPNLTTSSVKPSADRAFDMAGVGRRDVGLLSIYDCYTITVLISLEDAGFCPKGTAGRFVEEHDLRWNGDLPLNTHGGQLSYGQSGIAGGMSHVTEAVRQLQGRAGERNVAGLERAFVHGNGGVMGEQASLILGTR
ncbi:MAG: thiolase family protein [Actinomycetota bacterium]|nr:thiolase family protein [Actinomycetota bacterium]